MLQTLEAPARPAGTFADDAARWDAVRRRDAAADGQFFYSVATTGVYCRPSCAARLARRENVAFHATTVAAERAGFRPCKRCRPTEPPQAERHARMVAEACRTIERSETPPSLEALARDAGLSPHHFHRLFKAATGVTPRAYAAAHRARRMEAALATAGSVTEAIYDAGYGSNSRFYEEADARLGMTATARRRGGAGTVIRHAVGESSLGRVLVAATDAGIAAIMLGDDEEELVADLRRRFPAAHLLPGDADFATTVAAVVALVETPGRGIDLPLDVRGTAFQQRVWQALRAIPAGRTASYRDIAEAIGAPTASRAVAAACGANPVAVAIPCHRVLHRDGSLSGYRWGVARKRALLERERKA